MFFLVFDVIKLLVVTPLSERITLAMKQSNETVQLIWYSWLQSGLSSGFCIYFGRVNNSDGLHIGYLKQISGR